MNDINDVLEKVVVHKQVSDIQKFDSYQDNIEYKSDPLTLFITLVYSSNVEQLNRKRVDLNKKSILETVVATLENNLNLKLTSQLNKENFNAQTYVKLAKQLYTVNAQENTKASYINDLVQGVSTFIALENKIVVNKEDSIFCQYVLSNTYTLEEQCSSESFLDSIAAHRKLNKIMNLNDL